MFSRFSKRYTYTPSEVRQLPTEVYFDIVREQLAVNGWANVRVTGISMKPFLTPIRDTVTIILPDDSMKRGDIALFDTRMGRYILHRVTRVGEHDFDMRGDNTVRGEKKLPKAQLVGIVESANRNGRKISRGSALYRLFAAVSPCHYTWRTLWLRFMYPVASWVYHLFVPRKNGGQ